MWHMWVYAYQGVLKKGWLGIYINGLGLLAIYNSYTTREQNNKAILSLKCCNWKN